MHSDFQQFTHIDKFGELCVFSLKKILATSLYVYSEHGLFMGGPHLQHTRIAVAFAHWNFLLLFRLKNNLKNPADKCESYTRMLQINPPHVYALF